MFRPASVVLLLALLAGAPMPGRADGALEPEVAEIERLAVTAHWRESGRRIQALAANPEALSVVQRQRLEFVRLRNLALAGDQPAAVAGLADLLREEMPASLRLRVYTTAISIAGNIEDWPQAFSWLREALGYLPDAPGESHPLLGVASYLHTLVGETDKARELALRALAEVEAGDDALALCRALSDLALAEDHAGNHRGSEGWRRRQIDACREAGDVVFVANGKYGVGKMAAAQGRHDEALDWAGQALAEFQAAGFVAGVWSAGLVVAGSLIATGRDLERAGELLAGTLAYYRGQGAHRAVAETERQLAALAENRGEPAAALAHLKQAMTAAQTDELQIRERRLAYLQVDFDTRLKEQQIALLETGKALAELQATNTRRRQVALAAGTAGLLVAAILLAALLLRSLRDRRRYRWQSQHDGLTGLYNYQQVRRLGEAAFARARGQGRPFTAIVADIDRFKQVNDRHGHAAGDEALRALGGWIAEVVGGDGIAGRSGGDEFTILLEADGAQAEAVLRRLRERLRPITVFGRTFAFTLSSGLCQDEGADSLEQLVHEADRALYRAKRAGRDRVVCAETGAA